MLSLHPDERTRLYVIWEPVLDSDTRPPRAADTQRVTDTRAMHFWDPEVRVSKGLHQMLARTSLPVTGKRSLVDGEVVWDVVAIYRPGARWGDAPVFLGGPVVDVKQEALTTLREN
jgi:hypothetical protein